MLILIILLDFKAILFSSTEITRVKNTTVMIVNVVIELLVVLQQRERIQLSWN